MFCDLKRSVYTTSMSHYLLNNGRGETSLTLTFITSEIPFSLKQSTKVSNVYVTPGISIGHCNNYTYYISKYTCVINIHDR